LGTIIGFFNLCLSTTHVYRKQPSNLYAPQRLRTVWVNVQTLLEDFGLTLEKDIPTENVDPVYRDIRNHRCVLTDCHNAQYTRRHVIHSEESIQHNRFNIWKTQKTHIFFYHISIVELHL
jgi:hypothetical protein